MPPLGSNKPQTMNVAPPAPVFPWLNKQYTSEVGPAGMEGFAGLRKTAKTGNPIDVMPLFDSIVNARQRVVGQGRANVLENLGASGLRYGSTARDALVDYETQTTKDFTQTIADLVRSMGENAANRSTDASKFLAGMFGSSAMTLAPTQAIVAGGTSGTQAGIQSGLQTIALLAAMGAI